MHVLMVSQFYPPVSGGQEQHVRNLAHALAARGHDVEVVSFAAGSPPGTALDGAVRLHRVQTSAQHLLPRLYSEASRPHAMPIADPAFRSAVAAAAAPGRFEVVHAHDWSVSSVVGPAGRRGCPWC